MKNIQQFSFGIIYFLILDIASSKEHEYYMQWESPPPLGDEQRLLARLMTNYDKNTRPVINASHSVNVKLGITLNQIFDLDERNQVLTTHIWLDQEWKDEKMGWDPKEYSNLKTLRVPSHLIWKPDIVLYNSADDYTNGYMPALSMISNDGHVFWPPIVKLRSTCRIDITYFPFDDQICSLKLGSWAYDGLQVDVLKRDKPIDTDKYVNNGEWELMNVKSDRNVVYYSCCPEPYPDVTFTLHLRRRSLYYTYNVIIPCIMLSSLTLLAFWMAPEGGEKVGLGLTVLLAFSVFMLLIAENMPATSFYIPLIGVYIIVAMGLTCVSVTMAVAVSYIYHQGSMNRDVPLWLRKSTYYLNRLVRARKNICYPRYPYHSNSHRHDKEDTTFINHMGSDTPANVKTPLQSSYNSVNFTFRTETSNLDFENIHIQQKDHRHSNSLSPNNRKQLKKEQCQSSSNRKLCGTGPLNGGIMGDPNQQMHTPSTCGDELIRKLDMLLNKHGELLTRHTAHGQVNKDWQEISEVWDRFLFWVYLTMTTTITIIILVLVPLGKRVTLL